MEVGAKAFVGDASRVNLAGVPDHHRRRTGGTAIGGRTSKEMPARPSARAQLSFRLAQGLTSRFAASYLRAIYDEGFRTGSANTLSPPATFDAGHPRSTVFGDLA